MTHLDIGGKENIHGNELSEYSRTKWDSRFIQNIWKGTKESCGNCWRLATMFKSVRMTIELKPIVCTHHGKVLKLWTFFSWKPGNRLLLEQSNTILRFSWVNPTLSWNGAQTLRLSLGLNIYTMFFNFTQNIYLNKDIFSSY